MVLCDTVGFTYFLHGILYYFNRGSICTHTPSYCCHRWAALVLYKYCREGCISSCIRNTALFKLCLWRICAALDHAIVLPCTVPPAELD